MVRSAEDDDVNSAVAVDWFPDWIGEILVLCKNVVVAIVAFFVADICAVWDAVPFKPAVTVVKLEIVIITVGFEWSALVVMSFGS